MKRINSLKFAGIVVPLLALIACSQEQAPVSEPSSNTVAEPPLETLPAQIPQEIATVVETIQASIYEAAVADPRRPAEDVERDAGRKPAEVIEFFGIQPGHRVIDMASGGGYFTRIYSGVVGPEGSVVTQNSGRRVDDERKANLAAQYATYDNVELNFEAPVQMSLPDNSVDVVTLTLSMHHWHYSADEGEALPMSARARYENIYRMLKPGGVFAVVEHRSQDDATRQASAELHRIPSPVVIADLTSVGFELGAESDIHANHPEDDVTGKWGGGNTPRGMTNRIVHRYVKPAG
jgi:predicted methyltransferase